MTKHIKGRIKMRNNIIAKTRKPEPTPPGLRTCPIKRDRNRRLYIDRYCDKERCGLWNDKAGRCGLIR